MKLTLLSLKNYRRFKDVRIEFPDGLVGIIGENGSGKSSLMEAVAWALYGNEKAIVRTDRESLKWHNAAVSDPCQVILEFEFERSNYRVERTMKGKNLAMTATLQINGKLMANGAREVTEAVGKTLGMDHKSFFISVYAQQKELNALTSLKPAERRNEILRMLGIEDIDDAIKAIRTDARENQIAVKGAQEELHGPDGKPVIPILEKELKEKQKELKILDKKLNVIKKVLGKSEKEYEKLRGELKKKEKLAAERNRLQKKAAALSATLKSLAAKRDELKEEIEASKEIEKKFKEFKPKVARTESELEGILKKQKTARSERDKILTGISEKKAEVRRLQKEIFEIKEELKNINELGPDSECPTCKRRMDDAFGKLIKIFDGQLIEKEKKIKVLDKTVLAGDEDKKGCEAKITALEKRERLLRNRISEFEILKTKCERLANLQKRLESVEKELKSGENEFETLQKKLADLEFNEKEFEEDKVKAEKLAFELRKAERELGDLKVKHGRLETGLGADEKEISRLKKIESQLSEKMELVKTLNALEEVMKSFKQYMISRIRPNLAQSSSDLMGQLTEGRYSDIVLDENYDISMADGRSFHSIDRFSGGEKDLANLCIRLAISQVIADRSGSTGVNFIVLDEIFGSQDVNRRKNIFSALNSLGNRFKQMFLITHMDEVKDMMANVILIKTVDDGTSLVEVV